MREIGSGSGQALDHAIRQAGRNQTEVKIAVRLGSNEAVLHAVSSGYGGAFVSEMSVQHWNRAEGLCRIHVDGLVVDRKIWMVKLKGRTPSTAAEAFSKVLKNRYRSETGKQVTPRSRRRTTSRLRAALQRCPSAMAL